MNRLSASTISSVLLLMLAGGPVFSGDFNYDLYGKIHVSLNGVSNSEETGFSPSSNASHFGLKGSIGVSERLDAIWQFEGEFNTAQGDYTFGFNRNSFAGLKGSFGTVLVGIHDTPLKTLGRKITYFEDTIGDFRSTTMDVDRRFAEVILYDLPLLEMGLGGQLAYRVNQNDWTDPEAQSAASLSGMLYFAPADYLIGLGYESNGAGNFDPVPDETETESIFRGVGRVEIGKFGLAALYQAIDNYGGADGLSAMTLGFEGMFGPSEQWRLKGSYYATDPNTDLDDNSYAQLALGLDYILERVTFYAQYALMQNDDNQNVGLGNNDWGDYVLPSDLGKSASGFSLGLCLIF